ncbi:MAG: hypothetical protein ACM3XM_15785 [Mycobacterium leprae]
MIRLCHWGLRVLIFAGIVVQVNIQGLPIWASPYQGRAGILLLAVAFLIDRHTATRTEAEP